MDQLTVILKKIQELNQQPSPKTEIDIDLMLDYTRQLYATLLEARAAVGTQSTVRSAAPVTPTPEFSEPIIVQPEIEDPIIEEIRQAADVPFFIDDPLMEDKSLPTVAETEPAPAPARDIRKIIGINDKYQIISELFHNDKEVYETAIDQINRSNNFQEATDWLHSNVSWDYNWNEDSYTVQLFYGLINHHFSAR